MNCSDDRSHDSLSNNDRIYGGMINLDKLPSSCLLCQQGELKQYGHIIPKFVMRWLKLASKKEKFYLNNLTTEASDTLALKMLCSSCENKFSKFEKVFTDKYFKTYYRKKAEDIIIDGDIYLFALSVAWRILASTPIIDRNKYGQECFSELECIIRSYLLRPDSVTKVSVYVFHADEIISNIDEQFYNKNLLKYSVRQGIFCQYMKERSGGIDIVVHNELVPLVHFKLGVFYFMVSGCGYIESLKFNKLIYSVSDSPVYMVKYSNEMMGFLARVSNGDFNEVMNNVIPNNVEYDVVAQEKIKHAHDLAE